MHRKRRPAAGRSRRRGAGSRLASILRQEVPEAEDEVDDEDFVVAAEQGASEQVCQANVFPAVVQAGLPTWQDKGHASMAGDRLCPFTAAVPGCRDASPLHSPPLCLAGRGRADAAAL